MYIFGPSKSFPTVPCGVVFKDATYVWTATRQSPPPLPFTSLLLLFSVFSLVFSHKLRWHLVSTRRVLAIVRQWNGIADVYRIDSRCKRRHMRSCKRRYEERCLQHRCVPYVCHNSPPSPTFVIAPLV